MSHPHDQEDEFSVLKLADDPEVFNAVAPVIPQITFQRFAKFPGIIAARDTMGRKKAKIFLAGSGPSFLSCFSAFSLTL